ncbi:hypothetical protein ACWGRK_10605 [Saccharomonospora azurea]|uniref:hypothetical protein n=1 Tax=Saccharomonospora azurea TaxID=40988 RepID=UPI00030C2EB6|nr:hypothetical protein [Saccharomonospora azurea]
MRARAEELAHREDPPSANALGRFQPRWVRSRGGGASVGDRAERPAPATPSARRPEGPGNPSRAGSRLMR